MKVWESAANNGGIATTGLLEQLKADADVSKHLDAEKLTKIFDLFDYTKESERILNRAFNA